MISKLIEPYNPAWKQYFEEIKHGLETRFTDLNSEIEIQHVGSTAVPGVAAKPVLDIDIIINKDSLLKNISDRLEKMGYINKGEQGIPGRFAFRPFLPGKWHPHHLYVCFSNSLALKNHLVFRDALLNDKGLAEKYSALKLSLVADPAMTREKYTRMKTDFIIAVLATAGFDKTALNQIMEANK